jgi:hypothetical protein
MSKLGAVAKSLRDAAILCVLTAVLAVVAAETVYRLQIIDTYKLALRARNSREDLEDDSGRPTLLVFGDSFSMCDGNWVDRLRDAQDQYRVINGAISGTGIKQAGVIAPGRIKRFKPSLFIYQIYVGNDLYDIRYPVNWNTLTPIRNAYWTAADRLYCLSYLNWRLGQLLGSPLSNLDRNRKIGTLNHKSQIGKARMPFSPERYGTRVKLEYLAEPRLIENSALLRGGREKDFGRLLKNLHRILGLLPEGCSAVVIVIPHCAQVMPQYLENMKMVGAEFTDEKAVLAEESPFVARLRAYLAEEEDGDVRVLDLLPGLRDAEEAGGAVYFPNDLHLNERGQEVVARTVLDALFPVGGDERLASR